MFNLAGRSTRLVGSFCHRLQAATVGDIERHRLRHDQRMFGIHGGLHVIGRSDEPAMRMSRASGSG